ncbi:hypothetical protein [Thermodesulfovibrio yellowstonii]|uniref:hypothetical protein n=1 Tax=Thermodesulfovibrio yellowstonii TaxID=28262 RepID=UPI0024B3B0E3|nr:hypothetical protein [Thermodesulfovibrio yellowstonii]MDI6865768.1 hypothetical protein [Thermodesulfovibrio yellowstonii]
MERLTKETLAVMSKEELQEAVETLQTKLEVAERQIDTLKADAEVGKKYIEHLKSEAIRLIRAVEGESSPIFRLIERADVDTLRQIVDEYLERGKEKFKSTSTEKVVSEEVTKETLLRADYSELIKLKERFING